eukprot:499411-Amphidinium_carterae.1
MDSGKEGKKHLMLSTFASFVGEKFGDELKKQNELLVAVRHFLCPSFKADNSLFDMASERVIMMSPICSHLLPIECAVLEALREYSVLSTAVASVDSEFCVRLCPASQCGLFLLPPCTIS